ncbi:hypothetical protein [Cryobacterium sp. GrIS_2_6]|uniref:hypothetical protein n=1 Tax=Cryobacterium sp. GrIS_2_6 TaxID=3162785 RepID=UPI002DFBD61A|nr:hypothetical protein [Cryobacterium psychrotolerans]
MVKNRISINLDYIDYQSGWALTAETPPGGAVEWGRVPGTDGWDGTLHAAGGTESIAEETLNRLARAITNAVDVVEVIDDAALLHATVDVDYVAVVLRAQGYNVSVSA